MTEEFIDETDQLIAAILRRREQWLYEYGSGDTQTRAGYTEGTNAAIEVIDEFYRGREESEPTPEENLAAIRQETEKIRKLLEAEK